MLTLWNGFQHQITFTLCNLYLGLMSEENPITVSLFISLFLCLDVLVVFIRCTFTVFLFFFFFNCFFLMHKKYVDIWWIFLQYKIHVKHVCERWWNSSGYDVNLEKVSLILLFKKKTLNLYLYFMLEMWLSIVCCRIIEFHGEVISWICWGCEFRG